MIRANPGKAWHREAISKTVEQVLSELAPLVHDFYLAGGTGLALHLGHRRSQDLDLFSPHTFGSESFIHKLQGFSEFGVTSKGAETLHYSVRGVKISMLTYPYPLLFPPEWLGNLRVAQVRDIACMKIAAIAGRATKRDFVDLYLVSRDLGLPPLLDLFRRKFAQANYSLPHVLKSLAYFEEADIDPMPDMLIGVSWPEVKEFFRNEVPRL
jgi:hypothetical protein